MADSSKQDRNTSKQDLPHNPNADIEDEPFNAATPEDPADPPPYPRTNSGLRAAGHGGGEMDDLEQSEEAGNSNDYVFSAGGRGHLPLKSQDREVEEDLESRNGPYTRGGHPAADDAGGPSARPETADGKDQAQVNKPDAASRNRQKD